ncbi:probable LRR receptor-like serine/threonine-protein kinase At1g07650 [Vitis riparia]|uniref:probable LRR receptor-like serine/threonine-protein kinase At1g07650 n=1 Tax=Vitis riparia TaxID=96939 RepID=UPI00155A2A2E|nr:probable LRR receptor-like serine/threonine-protein kinase At1g07650 [Vitis riparia]
MHELSEAFHAISLRHTCLLSILEQFSKLSSRAGRISDLNGEGSTFPPLRSMKRMMLRGCNISGPIPTYIVEMTELRFLDLSFNKLNREIPNLDGLTNVEVICLTGNRLNGNIPDGIKGRQSRTEIDLSYSNFSEQSALPSCGDSLQELFLSKLNLVKL